MNLRDMLLYGLTGYTQDELEDEASLGRGPIVVSSDAGNLDKAIHALASRAITRRFGPGVAEVAGGGKELLQGVGSVLQGGPFFGQNAYDPADIEANYVGIGQGATLRDLLARR